MLQRAKSRFHKCLHVDDIHLQIDKYRERYQTTMSLYTSINAMYRGFFTVPHFFSLSEIYLISLSSFSYKGCTTLCMSMPCAYFWPLSEYKTGPWKIAKASWSKSTPCSASPSGCSLGHPLVRANGVEGPSQDLANANEERHSTADIEHNWMQMSHCFGIVVQQSFDIEIITCTI